MILTIPVLTILSVIGWLALWRTSDLKKQWGISLVGLAMPAIVSSSSLSDWTTLSIVGMFACAVVGIGLWLRAGQGYLVTDGAAGGPTQRLNAAGTVFIVLGFICSMAMFGTVILLDAATDTEMTLARIFTAVVGFLFSPMVVIGIHDEQEQYAEALSAAQHGRDASEPQSRREEDLESMRRVQCVHKILGLTFIASILLCVLIEVCFFR